MSHGFTGKGITMKQPTQCERILNYMTTHGRISDSIARDQFGCHRLASRICDLGKQGYRIDREDKTVVNRYGQKVQIREYWLA